MKPSDVMQALYDSEITVRTEPDGCWDGGFRARFGDSVNGFKGAIIRADKWDELMLKLAEHAVAEYPDSEFAKRLQKGAADAE
jgi:hypothetical protein